MPTERNMRLWPSKDWWFKPSGYHEEPYDLLDWIEAPAIAHPIQGLLTASYFYIFGLRGFALWWAVAGFVFLWQAFNWERLDWVKYPLYNVIWRILLAVVPLGILLWVLSDLLGR